MGRRKRPSGRKIYTIAYLLDKQPKGLRKDPRYGAMTESFSGSRDLGRLRFNRRCYSLLNEGIIKPEQLDDFYRTYRLPRHPFFPLFLAVKTSYLRERDRVRKEREEYIRTRFEELPLPLKLYLREFALWEKGLRGGGKAVIFHRMIYPGSKKRVHSYLAFGAGDWERVFSSFTEAVQREFPHGRDRNGRILLDRFTLNYPPPPEPLERKILKERYRQLCFASHPDRGGEEEDFLRIREAYERLVSLC